MAASRFAPGAAVRGAVPDGRAGRRGARGDGPPIVRRAQRAVPSANGAVVDPTRREDRGGGCVGGRQVDSAEPAARVPPAHLRHDLDPRVLSLDEATSALDGESEQLVQQALGRLMQGRTTVVVAHRLSTIRTADRVVVLDAGRIPELGTHAELLARGGAYARLYAAQAAAWSTLVRGLQARADGRCVAHPSGNVLPGVCRSACRPYVRRGAVVGQASCHRAMGCSGSGP